MHISTIGIFNRLNLNPMVKGHSVKEATDLIILTPS